MLPAFWILPPTQTRCLSHTRTGSAPSMLTYALRSAPRFGAQVCALASLQPHPGISPCMPLRGLFPLCARNAVCSIAVETCQKFVLDHVVTCLATQCHCKGEPHMQARPLTVENDLQPVTSFLRQQGLTDKQICDVVSGHPPVLCYSDTARLQPLFDFLESAGIDSVSSVRSLRPLYCASRHAH